MLRLSELYYVINFDIMVIYLARTSSGIEYLVILGYLQTFTDCIQQTKL